MPVARAYLEHHVVLAVLLHELLAVAHVPAQICEVGWGKRSARGSPRRSERQIAAAESRRTFLQSLEVIRLDRELVLDRLQGRHRGLCPLPRVRRARSEWRVGSSSSRESSACQSARRTSDFKIFVSGQSVSAASKRSANFLPRLTHACAAFARGRARAWGHVLLRRPALAQGRAGSDMGTPHPDDAPRARAERAFPPLLFRSRSPPSFDRARLTRPPRRAFADPGAPAEPRGSPEPAQIRQALRGGRVRHHHEAPLSAGTSSRARRKRVSDTTPETSRGSPRARTRRRALTCRIRGGAPTTRIVAGTSTRRAADARGRDPVLPPGTRAARSPAASLSFSHVKYVFVVAFFFSRFPPSDALLFFPLFIHTSVTKPAALPVRGLLFVPHAPRPPRARLE